MSSREINALLELEVTVNYDYQPYEPQTQTDPKVEEDYENISVSLGGIDITEQLDEHDLEVIRGCCVTNERPEEDSY